MKDIRKFVESKLFEDIERLNGEYDKIANMIMGACSSLEEVKDNIKKLYGDNIILFEGKPHQYAGVKTDKTWYAVTSDSPKERIDDLKNYGSGQDEDYEAWISYNPEEMGDEDYHYLIFDPNYNENEE